MSIASFRAPAFSVAPCVEDFGNGCFAYLQPNGSWGFSNAGLVTDGGEALLVDTFFDKAHTQKMLAGFSRASRAAGNIRTLVNTHQNGDHWFGNALVECAEIIATERAAAGMQHENPQLLAAIMAAAPHMGQTGEFLTHCFSPFNFQHGEVRLPDTVFSGRTERVVGSKHVELVEVGPAHTGGDAIVHVPADRTVFTGDILFVDGHPIMWDGPSANWIAACDMILGLDVETIVPGHGPVTDKSGVRRVRDYLVYIRDEARKRFDAGLPALEAARDISLSDYESWGDAERIAANVAALYREFGATDVPSDAQVMFEWMAKLWQERRSR